MVPQDIILQKSLMNSHCLGMDSLVIKDTPNMVRMFIARRDHTLWRNEPNASAMSIALHSHHCDVTLMPILGNVYNVTPSTSEDAEVVWMKSWKYKSPILEEKGGFESLDSRPLPIGIHSQIIKAPLFLSADKLHTIYVPYGQEAAWFIWEGKECSTHSNIVYSNADLSTFDFSQIDLPMTTSRLREDLAIIGVR